MTPDILRARMLAAVGLPAVAALAGACREAEHPIAATEVVVASVDGGRVEATSQHAPDESLEPRTCRRDAVLEHVCGLTEARGSEVSMARCGEDATSVVTKIEASSLTHADGFYRLDPGAEALKRDDALTVLVRKRADRHQKTLCCYSSCADANVAAEGTSLPPGVTTLLRCTPLFRAGTSAPAPRESLCAAAIDFGDGRGIAAYEERQGDRCCYRAVSPRPTVIRGRPLREAGVPILAPTVAGAGGWTGAHEVEVQLDASDVDPRIRAELAKAFAIDGALEHASVAAFARLALDLMVLGAPADLVDGAHVAARDEIRHARIAYALASSFAGEGRGPGPLPIGDVSRGADLLAVVEEAFVDGCIGETAAALELGEASALACAPIASVLERMASEEASHAELAWRIVAWGLDVGGEPVARRLDALVTELGSEQHAPAPSSATSGGLSAYGILDDAARREIRARAVTEVALPCARALVSARAARASSPST